MWYNKKGIVMTYSLAALRERKNIIMSRGKTSEGTGVLRKIERQIRAAKQAEAQQIHAAEKQ